MDSDSAEYDNDSQGDEIDEDRENPTIKMEADEHEENKSDGSVENWKGAESSYMVGAGRLPIFSTLPSPGCQDGLHAYFIPCIRSFQRRILKSPRPAPRMGNLNISQVKDMSLSKAAQIR